MKPLFIYRLIGKVYNVGADWDKLAPSEADAIAFAHQNINPEPKRFADAKTLSLEYCLAHSGESINERYRHNHPDEIDLKISRMVSTHKTKIPLVLYRGVCDAVFQQMQDNAKNIKGVDLYEKSFLQTSLLKGHEIKTNYRLRIYVPSGTQAIYLGNVNDEQFFYEVDIQCGSKLKILSIDDEYINCRLL